MRETFEVVDMACRMDPAILTPPLSASGSDTENQFSFDSAQSNDEFTAACTSSTLRYERKMGDTELSYFLPSRQTGVNDM